MKHILKILNDIIVGVAFTVSTLVCNKSLGWGLVLYIISYVVLNMHREFDKQIEKKFKDEEL